MIERKNPDQIGIPGGTKKDVADYIETDFKIRSGLCPNGCGVLIQADGIQNCPKCKFFTNTPCELQKQ